MYQLTPFFTRVRSSVTHTTLTLPSHNTVQILNPDERHHL